ncbi:MAG: 30S ribosomal protein S17 [candidate division KSB1 bacterium]|nr:30S ribosomal protein S17 [candidate division KSB1 bacterium]MDZ7366072.1 30S ribosomal protein S17 [candidate division KSB1 bacterium]MDZ7404286.1 30S ribosomal protein S17 [candidate division KSB1 bacterium]
MTDVATTVQEKKESGRAQRKTKIGKVISDKMQKSVVVSVERLVKHPLYGKYVKKTSTFMAHDENNDAKEGDTVLIMETRPLSARKRWRLVEILERAK